MEILRPPPGHQDDEAPSPPRNSFTRFIFAVLFLVIGMVVFFIGGLVVRNPELPNYLLDRIIRRFKGATPAGVTINPSRSGISSNITPPPVPKTAEEYLNLMNYDENVLSSEERPIASILNQAVPSVLVGSAPTEKAAGVPASLARQVSETFAQRASAQRYILWAADANKLCSATTRLVDLLSKNASKWKRGNNGNFLSTSREMIDEVNAARRDMNSAAKSLSGG